MSFEEEWARSKAAAEQQSVGMQLNRIPDAPPVPPANGDLKVSQKDLAAIGDTAYDMYTRLSKDGDHASDATRTAGTALKEDNFALGGALSNLATEWTVQCSPLLGACAHISNHLDYTKGAHAGDEEAIATSFSILQLESGFNEGTQQK